MSRRSERRPGTESPSVAAGGRPHVVAVVVPEPADAVALVDLEPAGAEIAVVALRAGTQEGRGPSTAPWPPPPTGAAVCSAPPEC